MVEERKGRRLEGIRRKGITCSEIDRIGDSVKLGLSKVAFHLAETPLYFETIENGLSCIWCFKTILVALIILES